ncbi:MAG TPA: MurT ligase domain-containing protein [Candidatus Saccharimonadales bacterium]|nr:MurT ligase domain-containing protein [Candidatus Saccharimonadales bacterium]
MIRAILITVAKLLRFGVRLFGGHGSALPGLLIERLDRRFFQRTLSALPHGIVVVTGTNGKTTTTRMLVQLLRQSGLKVLTNPSGSNLTRGLVSTIIEHSSLSGRLPYDIAVFELDEAYAPLFSEKAHPRAVVALNVMRDQLDRYGETDATASLIAKAAQYAETLIVNGDDQLLFEKTKAHPHRYTFGLAQSIASLLSTEANLYKATAKQGAEQKLDAKIVDIKTTDSAINFSAKILNSSITIHLPLLGVHNALNAIVAIITSKVLLPDLDLRVAADTLSHFKPAFGRGETLKVRDKEITIALIKNPSGFTQNLSTFVAPHIDAVLIVINDEYADGRDVSWLWDVQMAKLEEFKGTIFVSGKRRYDMALRLKYQGIAHRLIDTDKAEAMMGEALASHEWSSHLLIIPTYTAMLAIRKWLKIQEGGKRIW